MAQNEAVDLREWLQPIGIFCALAGGGILVRFLATTLLIGRLRKKASPWTKPANSFATLIAFGMVLAGLSYGLETSPIGEDYPRVMQLIHSAILMAWVLLVTLATIRIANSYLLAKELEVREDFLRLRDVQTRNSLLRKVIDSTLFVIGLLYAIRAVGGDVTPLLAGGTVGGIILGLALQDSLSHFFSGVFMNLDRPARIGDLIRLDDGREGYLVEIGWRYTRIRLWTDALLVIPNGKFAQSSVVNLHKSQTDLGVNVDMMVGHDADLDLVERLAKEAALEAFESVGGQGDPVVRFRSMTEGGIGFRVNVRAKEAEGSYVLSSEIMRRLHAKMREAGVSMPMAIRKVDTPAPAPKL